MQRQTYSQAYRVLVMQRRTGTRPYCTGCRHRINRGALIVTAGGWHWHKACYTRALLELEQ